MNPVHLLRSQNPYAVLFLMIFCLLAKSASLVRPEIPEPSGSFIFDFLQRGLSRLFGDFAFAYAFLSVSLVFAQSMHLSRIVRRHQLFPPSGYLPSFLYIIWTSIHPGLSQWGMPILLGSVFLYGLDYLLSMNQSPRPRWDLFHAGFAMGLAAALYFPALLLLLGLIMALVQLRSFQLREWLLALFGFIFPFYFLGSLGFLTDSLHLWGAWFRADLSWDGEWTPFGIYLLVFTVLIGLTNLYLAHRFMPRTNVFTSRTWVILLLYIPIAAGVCWLDPAQHSGIGLIMAAPASLLCLHGFHAEIRKGFRNFVFYFFIFFMVMGQLLWQSL